MQKEGAKMLGTVWQWFCLIGQLMFIVLFVIGIVCAIRDKTFKFSSKFEERHPVLVKMIYIGVFIWMLIGVIAAVTHIHITVY